MSKIIPFQFGELNVRVVVREGEPWFVAADACLASDVKDTSMAVSRLDDDERDTTTVGTPSGDQNMLIINESGLYSLIMTSRKPAAKKFKKWVTSEVLPSIRKTGAYIPDGFALESLPPAILSQIGGVVKAVLQKQLADAIRLELPLLLRGELAQQTVSIRHGRTAGQLWKDYKLPPLKNAATWFSARLSELQCHTDGGGRSESGGIPSKMFDPDKVAVAMKKGFMAYCKQYAQGRLGQQSLFPPIKAKRQIPPFRLDGPELLQ